MGIRKSFQRISTITACLAVSALWAGLPTKIEAQAKASQSEIETMRLVLGLDDSNQFLLRNTIQDELGESHFRFTQTYQGVKVWGGEVIIHVSAEGKPLPSTTAQFSDIYINTTPALPADQAMAIAKQAFGAKGIYGPSADNPLTAAPSSELVIFPETTRSISTSASSSAAQMISVDSVDADTEIAIDDDSETDGSLGAKGAFRGRGPVVHKINAENVQTQVLRYTLAYHISLSVGNEVDGIKSQDYMINANTGAVIRTWDSLETSTPARGRGLSQYSGPVWLDTTHENNGRYTLRDSTRGTLPHPVYALLSPGGVGNFTISNTGPIPYDDANNIWGDSSQWLFNGADASPNGQTAAVDAHYGMTMTWDFYKNIFGRNGIDNLGTSVMSVPHINGNDFFVNAFWSSGGFFMAYGDGAPPFFWNSLTSLDIAGHELSHGVTQYSGGLDYQGESGGLNESNSDIFGTMVEFYARGAGGMGSVIPNTGGNWLLGNEVRIPTAPPTPADPLRWMYKPSKDGSSFDAWDPTIEYYDVHYNSGPMNRCFYFMSQGSSSLSTSDKYSRFYPTGMAGIGNDHAARIWYRTLTTKLTFDANYWSAREGAIASARELYGLGSTEERAVANAFAAINVGRPFGAVDPFTPERELNDTLGTAQRLNPRVLLDVKGTMKSAVDEDWFSVDVPAGQAINAVLIPNAVSDYDLYLYDATTAQVAYSWNGTGWVDSASAVNGLGTTQTFYIQVIYWDGNTGSTGTYRMRPSITATPLY